MESMKYYAASICGLMALFVFFHLARKFSHKSGLAKKSIAKPFSAVSRAARSFFLRKAPGVPSRGHVGLALVYIGINIIFIFVKMDNTVLKQHSNIAARLGWLAISNVALVVFLSLKNTPLAYITAWSYERLNIIHQIAGYTTFTVVVLHASTYASYFMETHNSKRLRSNEEIYGITAAFCLLVMVGAASVIRRFWYELFYVMHLMFFMMLVVFIGLHQPHVVKKIVIVTMLVGSMWVLDRSIRFIRVVFYSFNNSVTVTPLPNGGTRIVLKKGPKGAVCGSHCFLWIPGVRMFEMHPFTIVSASSHEFVVASYDGFTRDLHRFATENPGKTLRASVEGPYGTFPDPLQFDRVVMIAGGSGGSFTFGTALNVLDHWPADKPLAFHWIVKNRGYFTWFASFIQFLRDNGKASVSLHVTRTDTVISDTPPKIPPQARSRASSVSSSDAGPASPTSDEKPAVQFSTPPPTRGEIDEEKAELEPRAPIQKEHAAGCSGGICGTGHVICGLSGIDIHTDGRPDVSAIIRSEIEKALPTERVLVIGCGPKSLMNDVRNTTARCIKTSGPGVELHCEQFGW